MRYWVYKDSRIMGPLSTEELSRVEGGGPDLLICPEGADGSRESDWRTAGEVPELASVFPLAQTSVGLLEAEPGDFDDWPIHGLSSEEIDSLRQFPSWGPGPGLGAGLAPRRTSPLPDSRAAEELKAKSHELETKSHELETKSHELAAKNDEIEAQKRRGDELETRLKELEAQKEQAAQALAKMQELEQKLSQVQGLEQKLSQVQDLEQKVSQYEQQQGQILENLSAKDRQLEDRQQEVERLRREVDELRVAKQAPAAEPAAASPAVSDAHAAEGPALPPLPSFQQGPVQSVPLRLAGFGPEVPRTEFKADSKPEPKIFDIPPAVSMSTTAPAAAAPAPFSMEPMMPTPSDVSLSPAPIPAKVDPFASIAPAAAPVSQTAASPFSSLSDLAGPTPAPAPLPPLPLPADAVAEQGRPPLQEPPSLGLAALASSPTPMPSWAGGAGGFSPPPQPLKTPDPFALPRTMITPMEAKPPEGVSSQMVSPPNLESSAPPKPMSITSSGSSPVKTGPSPAAAAAASKPNRSKKVFILGGVFAVLVLLATIFLVKGIKSSSSGASPASSGDGSASQAASGMPAGPAFGRSSSPTSAPSEAPEPSMMPSQASANAGSAAASNFGGTFPSGQQSAGGNVGYPSGASNSMPTSAPAPSRPDRSQDAIQMVKDYPLGADRHNIADWLQYQYLTPGSKYSWSANPGFDPSVFLVQYQVTQDGQEARQTEPIVYVFQADIVNKTVRGFNPAAQQLLSSPAAAPKSQAPAPKAKPRKHRTLAPGEIPQLPLPSESELRNKRKPNASDL